MGKGDEREAPLQGPAPLREPSPPGLPRVRPGEARPATPQEAREATEALLREILEEEPAGTSAPPAHEPRADSPTGEDWPTELHSLHLPET